MHLPPCRPARRLFLGRAGIPPGEGEGEKGRERASEKGERASEPQVYSTLPRGRVPRPRESSLARAVPKKNNASNL